MRVRPDQLASHLRQPLLPLYLVSGDEPLQVAEATDAIRAAARAQGFSERTVMHAEAGFDWGTLLAASQSLSLFAERRLLDLRIPGSKVGDEGAKALTLYAEAPPEDTLLLLTMGKLEKQAGKWTAALEKAGALITVWPVEHGNLPDWVERRMLSRGLRPDREAVQLLADRVEGNLLAAAQEIEKLRLFHGEGALRAEEVAAAVADSARFNGFELLEAALAGDGTRTARIVRGLQAEGEDLLPLLGLLMWEVRRMAAIAREAARGGNVEEAMGRHGVWEKRRPLARAALRRHDARRWQRLLARGARVDRVLKGQEPGNGWDELLQLALLISGVRLV